MKVQQINTLGAAAVIEESLVPFRSRHAHETYYCGTLKQFRKFILKNVVGGKMKIRDHGVKTTLWKSKFSNRNTEETFFWNPQYYKI